MDDLALWMALASVPGMHLHRYQKIIANVPLADFFQASPTELQHFGLTERQSQMLLSPNHARIERAVAWLLADQRRHLVRCIDPNYPPLLKQLKQPPLALFVTGNLDLLHSPQLAIVGSRQPTPTAKQIAYDFAATLSRHGLTITSGLAQGIDGAAHSGALSVNGQTIAVLGHGLQHHYPKQHAALTAQIAEQGALVSEFLPDVPAKPEFFPLRNRIVVGLSMGTLVVEAALKSGSLISANYAAEYNREVFAIPGSIYNPQAAGCHLLIQQGAKLTTCPADILDELNVSSATGLNKSVAHKNNCQQDLFESSLLANVGDEATAIDVIAMRAQQTVAEVSIALLQLELSGEVAAVPGGYIRVRRA